MEEIRVTKEFRFEAAHFLPDYDGLCANIHGHSYRLHVTFVGIPLQQEGNAKNGMVLDFSELKKLVERELITYLDHALIVRSGSWADCQLVRDHTKVLVVPFQPTCENLLPWMATRLQGALSSSTRLYALRLYETETSYADWVAQ